jgi:hypothetical protein
MSNLITSLISWALLLGVLGGLVDTTIALRNEAARAHSVGLVSLGTLNRSLLGEKKPARKTTRAHHP